MKSILLPKSLDVQNSIFSFINVTKNILTSNIWNLWTNHFPQWTRQKNIQNPPLRWILKPLSQFLFPQWLDIPNLFISFFNVYVFINNKRTVIARIIIFLRKYRYLNSLSNATHLIQIHTAIFEKLWFEKMV